MEFSQRLINLRKQKGLSQEQLGELIGVSRQTISKWEMQQTTPEMNKLIELANLFEISLDELTGNNENIQKVDIDNNDVNGKDNGNDYENDYENDSAEHIQMNLGFKAHYEYKSKKQIMGIPLVHINFGLGFYRAKGIIAIGNIAFGLLSIGVLPIGLLSLGVLAIGLLSFGSTAIGLLSMGAIALGGVAVGGVAIGYLAIGGVAIGVYSFGGCAVALKIAFGGYASGKIAIGDTVSGTEVFYKSQIGNGIGQNTIIELVKTKLPETPHMIINLLKALL